MNLAKLKQEHERLLAELDRSIALADKEKTVLTSAPEVSAWAVLDHLDHLRRADEAIIGWVERVVEGSVESDGRGGTLPGRVVMTFGRIPRGRGKAPEATRPDSPDRGAVRTALERTRDRVKTLGSHLEALAASDVTRRHHMLGCYTAAEWIRFAAIHHRHHRRITDDILRASTESAAPA